MRKSRKCFSLVLVYAISILSSTALGQKKVKQPAIVRPVVMDTVNREQPEQPKPYREIITAAATTSKGLFDIHRIDSKYYLEMPDSLLDKQLLIVNRISKAPALRPLTPPGRIQEIGYPGDLINESVVKFTKGPGNRVFLRKMFFSERSNDTTGNGLFALVSNTNLPPIIYSFPIKATGLQRNSVVLDITEFVVNDNEVLYFNEIYKKKLLLAALQKDKSYVDTIRSFPGNVEIRSVRTYGQEDHLVTYELNSSIIALPDRPMRPRVADLRVGYFYVHYLDYDKMPQRVSYNMLINKWRLEPRPGDVDKYLNGELVEPAKPIVFYIDPATPKKWVPYLIAGVNDWQSAFEQAGFKNAIMAKEAPVDDPAWSLEDAGHSVIVYKASDMQNASGPHIHDPRTGEILESHINWYHNVLRLLHNWYFIQAGPIDRRARRMEFDDQLMGRLVRYVIAHEVGHTLGLMHNFGASSSVPVDSLRSKRWVEKNGHTPSIMDYARFNYVAQPEDSIGEEGIMPRIGVYDKWAIEWGYRWFPPGRSVRDEKLALNRWVIDRVEKDNRLYLGYESDRVNPKAQSEDLGDDAIKASGYGIKNLKRISDSLMVWTKEPDEGYDNFKEMHQEVVDQYKRYLMHVVDYVGGRMLTFKTIEQKGPQRDFIGRKKQKEAIRFLQAQLFDTPDWFVQADKEIFRYNGAFGFMGINYIQKDVLDELLSHGRFMDLLWAQTEAPNDYYPIEELLEELSTGIYRELNEHKPVADINRRNLQKLYLNRIMTLLDYQDDSHNTTFASGTARLVSVYTDVNAILREHLVYIQTVIQRAKVLSKDKTTKAHLNEMLDKIARSKLLAKEK